MSGPRFDPTVSLGNILTGAAMLIAGVFAYASTDAKVTAAAVTTTSLTAKASELETRVRVLEISFASQASEIANIRAILAEIRSDLRQLVEAPRGP
jgi:hypothetical protein